MVHAMVLLRSIIISCNRLHTLGNTHHNHYTDKYQSVHNAIGTNGQVAIVFLQSLVDEDNDKARSHVHTERRETDGNDVLHNLPLQVVDASSEVKKFVLVAQNPELPDQ